MDRIWGGGITTLSNLSLGQIMIFAITSNFFRYMLTTVSVYFVIYVWKRAQTERFRVQKREPTRHEIRHEILYSLTTMVVFMLFAGYAYLTLGNPYLNKIYFHIEEHGWGYFLISIPVMLLIHDAYFYWMHRAIHHRSLYQLFHGVHHKSIAPTPFAALCFHPLEAVLEGAVIAIIIAVMPAHVFAIFAFQICSFSMNVIGHLGYEFFPRNWHKNPITRIINTSTYHNIHHTSMGSNFGLFFPFWDWIMDTRNPNYMRDFERVQDQRKAGA